MTHSTRHPAHRRTAPTGLPLLVTAILMAACSDDGPGTPATDGTMPVSPLQIVSVRAPFVEADDTTAARRAKPASYTEDVLTPATYVDLFMTQKDDLTAIRRTFYYGYDGFWHSDMPSIQVDGTYYVYGYRPHSTTGIATRGERFDLGTTLTISNLDPIVAQDVGVVTGVGTSRSDVTLGSFSYVGRSSEDGNRLYLLMDHIYAGLDFQFRVNEAYNALRHIYLKKIELVSSTIGSVTATVRIVPNPLGQNPIQSVEWATTPGSKELTLWTSTTNVNGQLLTPTYAKLTDGEFAPVFTDLTHMTLRCTYDVRHAQTEELIREDETAVNELKGLIGLKRGEKRVIKISVNPTYLYVLADPDAVDPEFVVE